MAKRSKVKESSAHRFWCKYSSMQKCKPMHCRLRNLQYFWRKIVSWSTSHCFTRTQRHPTILLYIGRTIRHDQLTRIYGYRGMTRTIYVLIMVKRWHDHRVPVIFLTSSQNPQFPLTLPLHKNHPKAQNKKLLYYFISFIFQHNCQINCIFCDVYVDTGEWKNHRISTLHSEKTPLSWFFFLPGITFFWKSSP